MKRIHALTWTIVSTALLIAACSGSGRENCTLEGCEAGFHCNPTSEACDADCSAESCAVYGAVCDPDSHACVADCTASGCDISRNLVCDPGTRLCVEGCRFADCPEGSHCDLDSELCAEDCTADSCPVGMNCSAITLECEGSLQFPDADLDRCIRTRLGRESIYPEDLAGLISLECQDMAIADLSGIELLEDLEDLSLYENQVSDLTPLAGLRKLRTLQLGGNRISDLAPLADLPALKRLGLYGNQVSDLSPLAGIDSLVSLNVDGNLISLLTPLVGLPHLNWLTAEHNPLADPASLALLQAAGCEVYAGLSVGARTRTTGRARLPALRPGRPAGFASPRPALDVQVDAAGRLSFWFQRGPERIRARPEFEGDILRQGDHLVHQAGPRTVVVGQWTASGPQLCSGAWAEVCSLAFGVKGNGAELDPSVQDDAPVYTVSLSLHAGLGPQIRGSVQRVDRLEPFALASPNQFDAGSCIFMANTGAMEILMNQHTPLEDIAYDGETDLSERFLMNGLDYLPSDQYDYFIIDLQKIYGHLGGSLLSRDYPFTANYVKENAAGNLIPCDPDDPDGYLSCAYNWFDFLPDGWQDMLTPTPASERTMIFLDPDLDENSIWNVALMNDDVIERIKFELRTRNAPVIIVYNHFLYWHADIIVGYDETESVGKCPLVEQTLDYFEEKGRQNYIDKIEAHMAAEGGCSSRGVFYVRDSIYDGGADEPWYDYSNEDVQVEPERYSKRIITRSTDWVKYLANHAYTVHRN